jgi:hypothetical protein
MPSLRAIGRAGLALGLLVLLAGVVAAVGSALMAGDWWLARQPWIGIGLTLLVAGLALTATFGLLLDVIEPVGWLRLLAVPPTLIVGLLWAYWLVVGLPTTGPGGPERDIRTMLYSLPEMLVIALIATLLIALPLVLLRLRHTVSNGVR